MTKTIQPYSEASLSETDKDMAIDKPETEDNMSLMLSLCDSLNNLYEKLSRLEYVVKRKKLEQIINNQNKGEEK